MKWKIAFFIWLKGIGIFAILCLIAFPIGILAIGIALVISWPAIILYSFSLQLIKRFQFSDTICVVFMMLVPSSVSVIVAMWLLNQLTDFGNETGFQISEIYLVPLFFCMLSVSFSIGRIRAYVNRETAISDYIIE